MPLYSTTTAAERSEAWLMVICEPSLAGTFEVYQISVVVPLELAAWVARDQRVPVWVIPETLPVLVQRVEITAISVSPETGGVARFTLKLVTLPVPLLPVAFCTWTGVTRFDRTPSVPASLAANVAVPDTDRLLPSRLFWIVRSLADAVAVPS